MNLKDANIPAVWIGTAIISAVAGTFWVLNTFALASDVDDTNQSLKQYIIKQDIKDNRQWLQMLEDKAEYTTDKDKKDKLLRQMRRIEQDIESNLEKIK